MNRRLPRSALLAVALLAVAPLAPARAAFTINTAASSWDPNFVYIRDTGLLLNVTIYATVWRGGLMVAHGTYWLTVPFDDFTIPAQPGAPFLAGDIVRVFQFGNGVSCATLVAGGTLSLTTCPTVGGMRAYNNFDRRGAGLSWNGAWVDPNSYTNGVATAAYLYPLGTNDPNYTPNWIGPASPSTGAPYTIHFDDYAAQPELWPLAAGGNTASLTETRFTVCIERLRDPNQNPGDPNVYYAARTVRVNLVFFGNPQPTSPACPLCPTGGADGGQLVSVVHSGVSFDITAARSLSQFSCFRVTGTVPAALGVRIPASGWIAQYHTAPSSGTLQPGVGVRFAGGDLRPAGPAPAGRGAWAGPLTPALGLVGSSLNGIVYADPNSDPNDPNAAGWLFGGVGEPTLDANCPPPPSTIGAIWNNSAQTLYYYTSTPGIDDPLTHVLQTPRSLTVNACAGDIDGDGDTDQDDLDVVLFEFSSCPGDVAYSGLAKLADECDRCINQNDLDVILFEFGCAAGLALHGGDTPRPEAEEFGAAALGPVAGGGLGDGRDDPTRGRSAGSPPRVLSRPPDLGAQDDIEITVVGQPIRIGPP